MNTTAHSEYARLQTVYIKSAEAAFISNEHIAQHWQALNYLSQPDIIKSIAEYEAFENIFTANNIEVRYFPENATVNMDSIYCRDASIATNFGIILCHMGKAARSNEPLAQLKTYAANCEHILGSIIAPGTIEGGDLAWLNETTLAVGHTYRTNDAGINQLKALLMPKGINIVTVQLPHYKGPSDVFHLMSILSPVDKDLAVVYSPLMPIAFRNYLLQLGYQLIEVPDAEFDSMGCNVLAIAPRKCVIVDGNPQTKLALEKAGCEVIVYKGDDISVKGGGGPTCLTRPLLRLAE